MGLEGPFFPWNEMPGLKPSRQNMDRQQAFGTPLLSKDEAGQWC